MTDVLVSSLIFGILSFILLRVGVKRGFFAFEDKKWPVPIRFFHVVAIFLIYFISFFCLTPLLGKWLSTSDVISYASWLHFLGSLMTLAFLFGLLLALSSQVRKKIFLRDEGPHNYIEDIRLALFAWVLSFPLVLFLSQFFNYLLTEIFHVKEVPEQLAVYFLRMTFAQPLFFVLTMSTIVIFAPLIEEMLFRGFLQSFIRQHLGSKQAIGITSVLFAFFHYSSDQGIANLPIIVSLFALSLFIGFIYEKRGSLAAPIALHAIFNAINVINLYFLGGMPGGL